MGPFGPEQVTALIHASGLEINLIVNAREPKSPNVLMDIPEKHAGFTHMALKIEDIASTEASPAVAGIPITGRRGEAPVKALFVRDRDGNAREWLPPDLFGWGQKQGHLRMFNRER